MLTSCNGCVGALAIIVIEVVVNESPGLSGHFLKYSSLVVFNAASLAETEGERMTDAESELITTGPNKTA